MDPIEIRLVGDSIKSVAPAAHEAAATGNHCPLEGTGHHPCGLSYEEGECQFCWQCSQMRDDLNRFLQGFRAAFNSEVESAWTQTSILLANAQRLRVAGERDGEERPGSVQRHRSSARVMPSCPSISAGLAVAA